MGNGNIIKEVDLHSTMDALIWAKEFERIVLKDSSIVIDADLMLTWFANAIMAGYDTRGRLEDSKNKLIEYFKERVPQGWCINKNTNKTFDPDLADSIIERLCDFNG